MLLELGVAFEVRHVDLDAGEQHHAEYLRWSSTAKPMRNPWHLLGSFISTADLLATMLMRWSRNMPRPATTWPHLPPYVTRMRSRPAFIETCRREGLTDWLNS